MQRLCTLLGCFVLLSSARALELSSFDDATEAFRRLGVQGSVLVKNHDQILYEQSFGFANAERKAPVTSATQFAIGSSTKQMTAAAILLLRDRGLLRLEDTLDKLLGEFHFPWAKQVTVHHLLTHTSGIFSYTDSAAFFNLAKQKGTGLTDDDILAVFRNHSLVFEPGSKWEYCNSGFFLAGLIIEKLSGKSFGEFLRSEFFIPLQMTQTSYDPYEWPQSLALPYDQDEDYELIPMTDHPPMKWANAAGGVISTVQDFSKWMTWLHHGKNLLSSSSKAALTSIHIKQTPMGPYGYGLSFGEIKGHAYIGHGGDMPGFHFMDMYFTGPQTQVIVAINQEPSNVRSVVAKVLMNIALTGRSNIANYREDHSVSEAVLLKYVGQYEARVEGKPDALIGKVTMDATKKRIYFQLDKQRRVWLVPQTDSTFAIKLIAEIKFLGADQAELTQNGATLFFKKTSNE